MIAMALLALASCSKQTAALKEYESVVADIKSSLELDSAKLVQDKPKKADKEKDDDDDDGTPITLAQARRIILWEAAASAAHGGGSSGTPPAAPAPGPVDPADARAFADLQQTESYKGMRQEAVRVLEKAGETVSSITTALSKQPPSEVAKVAREASFFLRVSTNEWVRHMAAQDLIGFFRTEAKIAVFHEDLVKAARGKKSIPSSHYFLMDTVDLEKMKASLAAWQRRLNEATAETGASQSKL
ncbi:MAG TPA: hypothetical protein VLE43_10430, partial [Candidatus Saccharimonadia bacterium]|nr:hypothetical protein [Candidatus Saccharimonadia bacterium]